MTTLQTDHRRLARAAARDALIDTGLDREQAERWCILWEREAARQGVAQGPYYWDSGRGWIDAQRAALRQSRRKAG